MSNLLEFIIRAKDEASQVLKGFQKQVEEAKQASQTFAVGLAGVAAGVIGFGAVAVQKAGEVESITTAFKTMLGSGEKANAMMQEITKFAAATPFEINGLAGAAKQLIAFNVEQKDVIPTLTKLGDIASGLNQPLGDIAYLYGTAKVQGRLFMQDINQFQQRGVPIIQELAKQFGTTEAEVRKLVEKGKVGFPDLEKAITSLTAEGSKFGGGMKAQSETLSGLMSTLSDSFNAVFVEIGQKLLPIVKPLVAQFIDFATNGIPPIIDGMIKFGGLISSNTPLVIGLAGAISGMLVPSLEKAAIDLGKALLALGPWAIVGAAVAGAAYLIYEAWTKNMGGFRDIVINTFNTVKSFIDSVTQQILGFIRARFDEWYPIVEKAVINVWNIIKTTWDQIWAFLQPIITGIVEFIQAHWDEISKIVSSVMNIIWTTIKTIWDTIWGVIKTVLQLIGGDIQGAWQTIQATIGNVMTAIWNIIVSMWETIKASFSLALDAIVKLASGLGTRIWEGLLDLATLVGDAFESAKNEALRILGDLLTEAQKIAGNIGKAIADGVQKAVSSAVGILGNSGLPGFSGFQYLNFPKRALGGPVSGNQPYLVGERGPEIFVPTRSGNIIPNNRLSAGSGGGNINLNVNFDFGGSMLLDQRTAQQITDKVVDRLRSIIRIPSRSI